MKKILLAVIATIISLGASAQTNFRELTFQQACDAAKAENKLVFIDFKTVWCGPCKAMARDVFPTTSVGNFMNERFVSIMVDAEKGEGKDMAKTYKVTAYPTFVIVNPDKKEVARTVGMKDAGAFVAELERILDPDATPEKLKARYESGERSADLIKKYAAVLKDEASNDRRNYQKRIDEVSQMVQEYYAGLTDAQKLNPENMFVYTGYTPNTRSASAKFMTNNLNKFSKEQQNELMDVIKKLYRADEYALLSGKGTTDPGAVASFMNDVNRLGLNKDGKYNDSKKLMEAYNLSDDQYIQVCKDMFTKVGQTQQAGIMAGIVSKFKNADEATKKKASRVIRDNLPDMDIQMLYTAVMELGELEGKGH